MGRARARTTRQSRTLSSLAKRPCRECVSLHSPWRMDRCRLYSANAPPSPAIRRGKGRSHSSDISQRYRGAKAQSGFQTIPPCDSRDAKGRQCLAYSGNSIARPSVPSRADTSRRWLEGFSAGGRRARPGWRGIRGTVCRHADSRISPRERKDGRSNEGASAEGVARITADVETEPEYLARLGHAGKRLRQLSGRPEIDVGYAPKFLHANEIRSDCLPCSTWR